MEFKFKIMKSQMLIKEGYGFIYAFYSAGNWIQGSTVPQSYITTTPI